MIEASALRPGLTDDWRTTKQIAEDIGEAAEVVRPALKAMHGRGAIEMRTSGRIYLWRLLQAPSQACACQRGHDYAAMEVMKRMTWAGKGMERLVLQCPACGYRVLYDAGEGRVVKVFFGEPSADPFVPRAREGWM